MNSWSSFSESENKRCDKAGVFVLLGHLHNVAGQISISRSDRQFMAFANLIGYEP